MSTNMTKPEDKFAQIDLSAPWIDGQHRICAVNAEGFDEATMRSFIIERSLVHKEFIRESEKTKRLG